MSDNNEAKKEVAISERVAALVASTVGAKAVGGREIERLIKSGLNPEAALKPCQRGG